MDYLIYQIIQTKKNNQAIINQSEGIQEDLEIVGFTSCGGCPGKKAVFRAKELVKRGADTLAFASCIQKGSPIGYPCPFAQTMREAVAKAAGENVRILDYTH